MPKKRPTDTQKYVAYYRVSTEDQGLEGLGIQAQKTSVLNFINSFGGEVVAEFEEVVSGGADIRTELELAIDTCSGANAILLVSKLDRLSRDGFKTLYLLDKNKVEFIEAESPNDSDFSQKIKFLLAKDEKDKVSQRVKAALSSIKDNIERHGFHVSKAGNKITSLGSDGNLTQRGRDKSIATRKAKAENNPNNKRAYGVLKILPKDMTLREVCKYLNENGFASSQGRRFNPITVTNLLKLYGDDGGFIDDYKKKDKE